jgi:hypothetical protein
VLPRGTSGYRGIPAVPITMQLSSLVPWTPGTMEALFAVELWSRRWVYYVFSTPLNLTDCLPIWLELLDFKRWKRKYCDWKLRFCLIWNLEGLAGGVWRSLVDCMSAHLAIELDKLACLLHEPYISALQSCEWSTCKWVTSALLLRVVEPAPSDALGV